MGIKLYRTLSSLKSLQDPVIATVGNFDGIHLGHQSLLKKLQERRMHLMTGTCLVMSFYPHPAVFFSKKDVAESLLTLSQRVEILDQLGIDALFLKRFTLDFSKTRAEEFILNILLGALKIQYLVLGEDAAFGHKRAGNVEMIKRLLEPRGVCIEVMPAVLGAGKRISSRYIREMVRSGAVNEARKVLGRPFTLRSRVVQGDARGRAIGFPTANLAPNQQIVPAKGVYACRASVAGKSYLAVTNVGIRPTFAKNSLVVEAHLIDYTGAFFYGDILDLKFFDRLRDESRFASAEELRRQIEVDIEATRESCGEQ